MLDFTSPELLGGLQYSITRKNKNRYVLIYARAYGMAATRNVSVLNCSTAAEEPIFLSKPSGRPFIWLDADTDKHDDGRPFFSITSKGMVSALLVADPPVVRVTGRTRMMKLDGARRAIEVQEVELLVDEDDLMRTCFYCGAMENVSDEDSRWKKLSGEGYETTYWCSTCEKQSVLSRALSSAVRYISS